MTKQTRLTILKQKADAVTKLIPKGGLIGKDFTFTKTGAVLLEQFRLKRLHYETILIETKYIPEIRAAAEEHKLTAMLDSAFKGFGIAVKDTGRFFSINMTIAIEFKRFLQYVGKELNSSKSSKNVEMERVKLIEKFLNLYIESFHKYVTNLNGLFAALKGEKVVSDIENLTRNDGTIMGYIGEKKINKSYFKNIEKINGKLYSTPLKTLKLEFTKIFFGFNKTTNVLKHEMITVLHNAHDISNLVGFLIEEHELPPSSMPMMNEALTIIYDCVRDTVENLRLEANQLAGMDKDLISQTNKNVKLIKKAA